MIMRDLNVNFRTPPVVAAASLFSSSCSMDLWTTFYIFSLTSWEMSEKFSWLVKRSAMSVSLRTPLRLEALAMIILRIYKSIWLTGSGQMGLDIPEAGPDREESSSSSHSQTLIDPSCDPSTSCIQSDKLLGDRGRDRVRSRICLFRHLTSTFLLGPLNYKLLYP